MHPVAAVLFGRAEAARSRLLELAGCVPPALWTRRARDGEWTAREHLGHALSSDAVVAGLVRRFDAAAFAELPALRQQALERASALEFDDLLSFAAYERQQLRRALEAIEADALDRFVTLPGSAAGATFSLTAYLEAWASHDGEHELAIRHAIAIPPDLSAVAHARRLS